MPASAGLRKQFWTFCPKPDGAATYEIVVDAFDKSHKPIPEWGDPKVSAKAVISVQAGAKGQKHPLGELEAGAGEGAEAKAAAGEAKAEAKAA